MTSATFTRPARTLSRRRLRIAAAAAGLTGALALTACSSGSGSDDSSSSSSPSTSASSAASSATGGGSGAATSSSDDLQGSWLTTKSGKAVALVITGKQAALFSTGGSVCSGTAGKESGMEMIHLTCTDGSKERATGMVDSASSDSLHITWSGSLGKETYTKAEGGKLPSGLPTTGLGQ